MDKKIKILLDIIVFVIAIGIIALIIITFNNAYDQSQIGEENIVVNDNYKDEMANYIDVGNNDEEQQKNNQINILATMSDEIKDDSIWCGTFQLVWNDLKNEVVKKDIIFEPQEVIADNLNKEEFKAQMISDEYYYKNFGLKTLNLKSEIENGIKQKFNQESDVLENIDWTETGDAEYLFYAMLYRKFEYLTKFDKLENGVFANQYEDVKYFGINHSNKTDEELKSQCDQIQVLYYNSENDFALLVNTKSKDEVIFAKGLNGNTFNEIYNTMNTKSYKFTGNNNFSKNDKFKAPLIEFDEEKRFEELEGKVFINSEGETGEIKDALQTIKLSLDEKGGEIKSEAAITYLKSSISTLKEENRYFILDDEFTLFLREKGKEKPYFAAQINDITNFQ